MFGYITINKPELKIKEFERYHGFYCGLCHILQKRHGIMGQITLTYDMTFLIMLLSSLYEPDTMEEAHRCMVHPGKKHRMIFNNITQYAADMNLALAYHNFADDWVDEKSLTGLAGVKASSHKYNKIQTLYPAQCRCMHKYLHQLAAYEAEECHDIDLVAGCFGRLMGSLFLYKNDHWSPILKRLGFYLGKFIYIMDAYMDLETDKKKHQYNPLIYIEAECETKESFEETCKNLLQLMIADCCREFEQLPLVQDVEILRNILYAGVWRQYEQKGQKTHDK